MNPTVQLQSHVYTHFFVQGTTICLYDRISGWCQVLSTTTGTNTKATTSIVAAVTVTAAAAQNNCPPGQWQLWVAQAQYGE